CQLNITGKPLYVYSCRGFVVSGRAAGPGTHGVLMVFSGRLGFLSRRAATLIFSASSEWLKADKSQLRLNFLSFFLLP
ncbi:MAG: hypothetical protein J5I94_15920, partial [Phaeodactylibacter sp.]|nr:hypothetical protein [Phaeodactylibacter sp.]